MISPLAKSREQGELTLLDHTRHVVQAIEAVARYHAPEQVVVARHGGILHDLGKAHPFFQESLQPGFDRNRYMEGVPHRHEISSLLFLPLFPRDEWPVLVDLVAGHHKSVQGYDSESRKYGRGIVDLVDEYGDSHVFDRHSESWREWSPNVDPILYDFCIETRPLTLDEVRVAFDFALKHCEHKERGWSCWRGMLMSADHFASAMMHDTEMRAAKLYGVPDLSYYEKRARADDAKLYPLAQISATAGQHHTLVIAPTGSGKTDFLLRRCVAGNGRVFYMLPFQASINAMYLRLDGDLNGRGEHRMPEDEQTDIRRMHAASRIEIDDGFVEEHILQRHPGAAIKVMTPHQVASIVFGTSGHEATALDVAGQNVILDEVHVYSDVAQAMVLEIVRTLVKLKCRVHIGSATIPTALADKLVALLGGEESVYQVTLPDAVLQTFDRHIVHKHSTEESAREALRIAIEQQQRVLFISNRVATAQERYEWVQESFPHVPSLLVHSRYRRCDRAELEKQIEVFDRKQGPCIVCATQVVEVSLDISFDCMITDAAPLDSLVQRFGRVNRRRLPEQQRRLYAVHVKAPSENDGDIRPYDADVVRRSYEMLPDGDVLRETSLQDLIDRIYSDVNVRLIDQYLIEKDGRPQLKELCHKPRCILIDVLEIESATCVRQADRKAYTCAYGDARQRLEIPVPWQTIRRFISTWGRLEGVGYDPILVPDEYYSTITGLILPAQPGDANADFTKRYI